MAIDKLHLHERIAASIIGASFLMLTLHTFLFTHKPSSENPLSTTHIQVTINGAVLQPGDYELPTGSVLSDLLDIAQPVHNANLARMRKQRKLIHGEEITIPTKKPITIYIKGQKAEVPPGTRVCDLRLWTDIDPKFADQLTTKRRLKDGEEIK